MEERLPLSHNHLQLTSPMTQSQIILYHPVGMIQHQIQNTTDSEQPSIKLIASQTNAFFPDAELKDVNMDFSKANITMNVLFLDIRDSCSIVCDTAYLKMLLSIQDLMVTFCTDGRRRKVKTDHEALHWRVSSVLCAQEICSYNSWRTEGRVASRTSNSMGPQGHREIIPKMQKCNGGGGQSGMYC